MAESREVFKVELQKNQNTKIVFTYNEYGGKMRVDIREFYLLEEVPVEMLDKFTQAEIDAGIWLPTKKGLNFLAEKLGEFQATLAEFSRRAKP